MTTKLQDARFYAARAIRMARKARLNPNDELAFADLWRADVLAGLATYNDENDATLRAQDRVAQIDQLRRTHGAGVWVRAQSPLGAGEGWRLLDAPPAPAGPPEEPVTMFVGGAVERGFRLGQG